MIKLVLQGAALTAAAAHKISDSVEGELDENNGFSTITLDFISASQLSTLKADYPFDINILPYSFDPMAAQLLITDMDSTLINIECVDEIADYINVKPQVAAITEAAMHGEIDFETSLRQRVLLLKGLEVSVLDRVYEERLRLNPGAEVMLKSLKKKGIKTALVSGGFTFFTEHLKKRLNLDFTMANILGEHNGMLTGEVVGDICGAQAKADFLLEHCKLLNISPLQTVAMGDGANDLLMMKEAGLSIAYHAKPTVQEQATSSLNYCGLEGVLGLLQLDFD
jgi:phosphoserine phosphatase